MSGAPDSAPTAVELYRSILSHVQPVEHLVVAQCLPSTGEAEEAQFDRLHLQITQGLAHIRRELTPGD